MNNVVSVVGQLFAGAYWLTLTTGTPQSLSGSTSRDANHHQGNHSRCSGCDKVSVVVVAVKSRVASR